MSNVWGEINTVIYWPLSCPATGCCSRRSNHTLLFYGSQIKSWIISLSKVQCLIIPEWLFLPASALWGNWCVRVRVCVYTSHVLVCEMESERFGVWVRKDNQEKNNSEDTRVQMFARVLASVWPSAVRDERRGLGVNTLAWHTGMLFADENWV